MNKTSTTKSITMPLGMWIISLSIVALLVYIIPTSSCDEVTKTIVLLATILTIMVLGVIMLFTILYGRHKHNSMN